MPAVKAIGNEFTRVLQLVGFFRLRRTGGRAIMQVASEFSRRSFQADLILISSIAVMSYNVESIQNHGNSICRLCSLMHIHQLTQPTAVPAKPNRSSSEPMTEDGWLFGRQ